MKNNPDISNAEDVKAEDVELTERRLASLAKMKIAHPEVREEPAYEDGRASTRKLITHADIDLDHK